MDGRCRGQVGASHLAAERTLPAGDQSGARAPRQHLQCHPSGGHFQASPRCSSGGPGNAAEEGLRESRDRIAALHCNALHCSLTPIPMSLLCQPSMSHSSSCSSSPSLVIPIPSPRSSNHWHTPQNVKALQQRVKWLREVKLQQLQLRKEQREADEVEAKRARDALVYARPTGQGGTGGGGKTKYQLKARETAEEQGSALGFGESMGPSKADTASSWGRAGPGPAATASMPAPTSAPPPSRASQVGSWGRGGPSSSSSSSSSSAAPARSGAYQPVSASGSRTGGYKPPTARAAPEAGAGTSAAGGGGNKWRS